MPGTVSFRAQKDLRLKFIHRFAVPEDKLVDAVREVLQRHGVTWE